MSGLKELYVSNTKNRVHMVPEVLAHVHVQDLLNNIDRQINNIWIDPAQVKSLLDYDPGTGKFPSFWGAIQQQGSASLDSCLFVAALFSHHEYIEAMIESRTGEMRGVLNRLRTRKNRNHDKVYTNLVFWLDKLKMATQKDGAAETVYNLRPLFTNPGLGPFYKQIIENKLRKTGWPGAGDPEFTRDFYEQCEEYNFHDVFALSPDQFQDWLEGRVVDVQEPPAATFTEDSVSVTASLLLALATKPFVILAGATGTGKTQSARQLAASLQPTGWPDELGFAFVPVAAGWTDARHLLGYKTPFGPNGENYVTTALVRLLLRANYPEYREVPFFVILDEMNLSQVEMYFSSFLSLIEVSQTGGREPVLSTADLEVLLKSRLHDALDARFAEEALKQGGLYFTNNVYVIGTVNVDDTTHTFSPKVLDRAFVLEYQPPDPSKTGDKFQVPVHDKASGQVDGLVSFLRNAPVAKDPALRADITKELDLFFNAMGRYRFGPRTTNEIVRYVEVSRAASLAGILIKDPDGGQEVDPIDRALVTKALPRLQGSRAMLYETLKRLTEVAKPDKYPLCAAKLEAMTREISGGYVNYFSA